MRRGTGLLLGFSSVVLTASLAGGCLADQQTDVLDGYGVGRVNTPSRDIPTAIDETETIQTALNGYLRGDIGPARGVDQSPDRLSSYQDGSYAAIESVVSLPDRVAMMLVYVYRADELFVAGTHETFYVDEFDNFDGAMQVTALGCTGQQMDVFDEYDVPADEVEVIVEAAPDGQPGDVDVVATARWYDADGLGTSQEASSSFRLAAK